MSNSTITQVGDALKTTIDTVANLRVHRHPPEQLAEFPCALIYSRSGVLESTTGNGARNFHRFNIDLLTSRQNIAQAAAEAEPYLTLVQNALWNDWDLNGTADHLASNEQITYELVAYEYAGKPVFGYRIVVPIKHHRIIT